MIVFEKKRHGLLVPFGIAIFSAALLYFVVPEIAEFSNALATAVFCGVLFLIAFGRFKKGFPRRYQMICNVASDHILFYRYGCVVQEFKIMFSEIMMCEYLKDEGASLDREDVYLISLKVRNAERYRKNFDYEGKFFFIDPIEPVPKSAKIRSFDCKQVTVIPVFSTEPHLELVCSEINRKIKAYKNS